VSKVTRRDVRELMRWSRGEAVIRAVAVFPSLCVALTLVVYRIDGFSVAPFGTPQPYGDYLLQSSPGWPRFVIPPIIYWFGIVPVVVVTLLYVLHRPARHMPDAFTLATMLLLDAGMTAVLSGSFLELEAWPHDLWIAAAFMAACAVVVTTVALRRRRRRRRAVRS
jgi:hypothetical protein